MWDYEYGIDSAATPAAVWRHWSAMTAWPSWNDGIEKIDVDGPFAVGTTFTMTAPGQDPIALKLTQIVPGEVFVDEMDAGDFVVTTVHRLTPLADGGTRITYRTEITGAAADQVGPQLGPAITGDFPEVLAALAAVAQK